MRRELERVDWLEYTKAELTLPLSPQHSAARLAWAKRMLEDRMDWSRVVFSDEKRFSLDEPDGSTHY